jgi:hypothetical protein
LLLPVSNIESPKEKTATVVSFLGGVFVATLWWRNITMMIQKTLTDEDKEERRAIVINM